MPRFKFHLLSATGTVNYPRVRFFLIDCDVGAAKQQLRRMKFISSGLAHARITEISRVRAPFVYGSTLQPPLVDTSNSDLSPNNVTQASDVSLLRTREKEIRICFGGGVDRSKWKSTEGDSCVGSRVSNLLQYIDWYLPKIMSFTMKIRASDKFNFELRQADGGRGEPN